jgi:hypothetical protein
MVAVMVRVSRADAAGEIRPAAPAGMFKCTMSTIEQYQRNRQYDFLQAVALCLVVAVVLLMAGAIFRSGSHGLPGLSTRNRIELISGASANLYTAALVLAAVAALFVLPVERLVRMRPLVVFTMIVGVAIALLAMYTVVDVLTIHVPSSSPTVTVGLSGDTSFPNRLGAVLPALGAVFVALVAAVGANRLGNEG